MAMQSRTEEATVRPVRTEFAAREPIRPEEAALEPVGRHAHWLLRFVLASVFLYMGIDKFLGGGVGEFAAMVEIPFILSLLVALSEIGAGVLLLAGGILVGSSMGNWLTRLGALMVLPVMFGAIFMEHWGQWHFMATETHPMGGMMLQVSLTMVALYLLIKGNRA
jgi:putative oxidoreductase